MRFDSMRSAFDSAAVSTNAKDSKAQPDSRSDSRAGRPRRYRPVRSSSAAHMQQPLVPCLCAHDSVRRAVVFLCALCDGTHACINACAYVRVCARACGRAPVCVCVCAGPRACNCVSLSVIFGKCQYVRAWVGAFMCACICVCECVRACVCE